VRVKSGSFCPRWRLPRFVWPGPVIFALFVLAYYLPAVLFLVADAGKLFTLLYPQGFPTLPPPAAEETARQVTNQLKGMWARAAAFPVVLAAAVVIRPFVIRVPIDWGRGLRELPRNVALGTLTFVTAGVATFALNMVVDWIARQFGVIPDEHPLSKMGRHGDGFGGAFFVLSACVVAPVLEEFVFRGLLVSWAIGRQYRPWLLVAVSAILAVYPAGPQFGPLAFVAVLAAAQIIVRWPGRRTGQAIWSTSVLFAMFHASVWPSPIPLFVLALGLGYVTARTRNWLPAAVAHGLFNLVSTLFVFSRG
jgi:membrane protease YdiL (CAAX protease family)